MNQDDCLAINKGSNITFQRNTCSGGHGISVVCVLRTAVDLKLAVSILIFEHILGLDLQ